MDRYVPQDPFSVLKIQYFEIPIYKTGLCSWVQDINDDVNWSLSKGLQVDQPWDGPQYDNTIGSNQGID